MPKDHLKKETKEKIKDQLQRISGQKGWKINKAKAWLFCDTENANSIAGTMRSLGLGADVRFTADGHKPIVFLEAVLLADLKALPDYSDRAFSLEKNSTVAIDGGFIKVSQSATARLDLNETPEDITGIFTDGLETCLCLIAVSPSGRRFSLTHTATAVDIEPIINECKWTGEGSRLYLIKGKRYDNSRDNFILMRQTSLMKKLASLSREYRGTITVEETYFNLPTSAVAITRAGGLRLFNQSQYLALIKKRDYRHIRTVGNFDLRNIINLLNTLTAQTILKENQIKPNDPVDYHLLDLQYDGSSWTPFPRLADRLLHFFNRADDIEKSGLNLLLYFQKYKQLLSEAENQVEKVLNPKGIRNFKEKNYEGAAKIFEEGLSALCAFYPIDNWIEQNDFPIQELSKSAKLIASLHNNLGRMYQCIKAVLPENTTKFSGYDQKVETHLRKSYEIKRKLFGEGHKTTQKAKAKYQKILAQLDDNKIQRPLSHEMGSKAIQKKEKDAIEITKKTADAHGNKEFIDSPDDLRQEILKMRTRQRLSGVVGTKVRIKVASIKQIKTLISKIHEMITTSNDIVPRVEYPYYHSHSSVPPELNNFKKRLSTIRTMGSELIADIKQIPASDGGAHWNDLSKKSFLHSLVGTLASSTYGIGDCSECSTLLFVEMLKNGYGNLAFVNIKFLNAKKGMDQAHQLIIANLPNAPKPANRNKITIDDLFDCLPKKALIADPFLNLCFKPSEVPEDFTRYIDVYGGETEVIRCFHLSNFAPRMIRAYEMTAEYVVAQLRKLFPGMKHYNHYLLEDKIELESETSIISWLKHSTQLPFFAVRDQDYKVDAVVSVTSESEQDACKQLKKKINNYGRFFYSTSGAQHFVIEGVNITDKKISVGELIRSVI